MRKKWVAGIRAFGEIHLVDKCLILFMAILLLQSTLNLFLQNGEIGEAKDINIIVRTAAASIFGYFLSGNFARKECDCDGKRPTNHLQICIATGVGLFCVFALCILRNILAMKPDFVFSHDMLSTISQFRDFVSGCVGFLIGTPTKKE
ncbi:MAG: hypothetical protein RSC76_02470 [Oscillospiraceae bacterium]